MTDIIDGGAIVGTIASSTSSYLVQFAPVFLLMGGLLIAVGVLFFLVGMITGNKSGIFDDHSND